MNTQAHKVLKIIWNQLYPNDKIQQMLPLYRSLLYLCSVIIDDLFQYDRLDDTIVTTITSILLGDITTLSSATAIQTITTLHSKYQQSLSTIKEAKRLFTKPMPRVIVDIDLDQRVVYCNNVGIIDHRTYCLSQRSQPRTTAIPFKVYCDHYEPYNALLTLEEASNIKNYLIQYGSCDDGFTRHLWSDYVCINPYSDSDKADQISIMGQIYYHGTTLIVGLHLSPTPPPEEYLIRAWCYQERVFGNIKINWDLDRDNIELKHIISYTRSFMEYLGTLIHLQQQLIDPLKYNEEWRKNKSCNFLIHYPNNITDLYHEIITNLTENNEVKSNAITLQLCKKIITLREQIFLDGNDIFIPSEWPIHFYRCKVTFSKDRLYAIWGIPCYLHDIPLDYNDANKSWDRIEKQFPDACYAFYTLLPETSDSAVIRDNSNEFREFVSVKDIVLNTLGEKKLTSDDVRMIHGQKEFKFHCNPNKTYLVIWDNEYIGIACDSDGNHHTLHFVATIECIKRGDKVDGERGISWKFIWLTNTILLPIYGLHGTWRDWSQIQKDVTTLALSLPLGGSTTAITAGGKGNVDVKVAAMTTTSVPTSDIFTTPIVNVTPTIKLLTYTTLHYSIPLRLKHVFTGLMLHCKKEKYKHYGSSKQNIVICFDGQRDDNDYFEICGPFGNNKQLTGEVTHGATIRLKHQVTGCWLHSQDGILSPVTRQQEVACYQRGDTNDNWRYEIIDRERFRLIHCNTNYALHSHSGYYFGPQRHQEVTCFADRDDNDLWCVDYQP